MSGESAKTEGNHVGGAAGPEGSRPAAGPRVRTVFLRLGKYEASLTFSLGVLGAISTLIGGLIGAYIIIVNSVTENVLARINKTQTVLIYGLVANQHEEFERSLDVLLPAVKEAKKDSFEDNLIGPLADTFLYALANCYDPLDRMPSYTALQPVLSKVAPHPFRHHHTGWFLFRVGRIEEARHHFQLAIDDPRKDQSASLIGDTYWAFALTHIAQNNMDEAERYYKEAEFINPDHYERSMFARRIYRFQHDRQLNGIRRQYPLFKEGMNKFLRMIGSSGQLE